MSKKVILGLIAVLMAASVGWSAIPEKINIQGVLTLSGQPVKDPTSVVFEIQDSSDLNGNVVKTQTISVDPDDTGFFNTALDVSGLSFDNPYYIEIKIGNSSLGVQPLLSAPYAITAKNVHGGTGYFSGNVGIGKLIPQAKLHSEASADMDRAIYGSAPEYGPGTNYGGYFDAAKDSSCAVYGEASGNSSTGVRGYSMDNSGTNFGVYGETASPNGYAGYFKGGKNYFEGNVGIGTTSPITSLEVVGNVKATEFEGKFKGDGTGLSLLGGQWTKNGDNIYYTSGKVGIGTQVPITSLTVFSDNSAIYSVSSTGIAVEGRGGGYDQIKQIKNSDKCGVVGASKGGYGVYGESDDKVGVYGKGPIAGGSFESTSGYGVYGKGPIAGGWFESNSGYGLYAESINGSAGMFKSNAENKPAVYAISLAPGGFGLYSDAVRNYFFGKVGIGTSDPKNRLDVNGGAVIGTKYAGNANAPAPVDGLLVEGKVGIGKAAPINQLDVAGGMVVGANYSSTNTAPVNGLLVEGNVGIGTTNPSPTSKLTVKGNSYFDGNVGIGKGGPINRLDVAGGMVVGENYSSAVSAPTNGLLVEGNVGIGTTSKGTAKLEIDGTVNPGTLLHIQTGKSFASSQIIFQSDYGDGNAFRPYKLLTPSNNLSNDPFVWDTNNAHAWSTDGIERMRIDSNGNVGIGTAETGNAKLAVMGGNVGIGTAYPMAPLEINYNSTKGTPQLLLVESEDDYARINFKSVYPPNYFTIAAKPATEGNLNTTAWLNFYYSQTGKDLLWIRGDGKIFCGEGTWAGSDIRLKNNIAPLTGVLDKVKNMRGVSFEWKSEQAEPGGGRNIGMIAQEVEPYFPELVSTDPKGYKSLSYDKFTAVLLEAIKEQQAQIDALKAELKNLRTEGLKN